MKIAISILAILLLPGCAAVPRDAGFSGVHSEIGDRINQNVQWRRGASEEAEVDAAVTALLSQPLTLEAAVHVALLNHRGLQAEYESLGIAQADLVQAGMLKNPSFGWSRLAGGGLSKTTLGIEFDFLGLLLAAPRKQLENLRFEHTRLRVTQAVLRHAMETRKAWLDAVAAEQGAGFLAQVVDLTSAEAALGERQRQAGNLSRRDALRQKAFSVETAASLAMARVAAVSARERLGRLMGTPDTQWKLPAHLPELPVETPAFGMIEAYGLQQRLDVRMAEKEVEAMAAGLKLARDTRFIRVLDVGVETEKGSGERRMTGPTLALELPIFDQGQARLSAQEAMVRQSEARLAALAVDARSEIREAQQRTQTAYDNARRYRDVLMPLRRQIVEQSTMHYNGMLIGVYELLADARDQVGAVQNHIAATREFWNALADLQMAVGGKLPEAIAPGDAGNEKAIHHGAHGEHGGTP